MLALSSLMLACQEDDPTPVAAVATATSQPTEIVPTETPAPTETSVPPTPTAEPTAIVPALSVSEQTLTEDGLLLVDQVVSPDDGWVLVYTTGENEQLLGQLMVPAGVSNELAIEIDPYMATATLSVRLHRDAGEPGIFEPDLDLPQDVTEAVAIALDVPLPSIVVSEQDVPESGFLLVDAVIAVEAGWLAIYTDADGAPDRLLAFVAVDAGLNEALPFTINRYEATTALHAILHEDAGEMGRFEPEVDPRVTVSGSALDVVFAVTLPLDLLVYDQLPFADQLVIERIVVPIDAFIAVYYDDDGQLGRVIGFAPLAAGVNENVVIEVQSNLVTPELFLAIHQDVAEPGVFDFPGEDVLLAVDGQIPAPYVVRTNPGNYMLTTDQPLSEDGSIVVPLVHLDTDGWVVVYSDEGGELGEIVGATGVAAGFLRDVVVLLDGAMPGERYHVVLHIDNAEVGEFEPPTVDNPTAPDIPFQRNRRVIRAPMMILGE